MQSDHQSASSSPAKADELLCHDGMITAIDPDHPDQGEVTILSRSACSTCHAKGSCTTLESQEKVMFVHFVDSDVAVGDPVQVMIKESLGWQALLLGMIIPLVLLLGGMMIAYFVVHLSDTGSALLGLGSLVPYYLVLSLQKKRFTKRFIMYAKKI